MRNFFAKYELVWILPLSLIVALLSVMGLGFMQQQKLQEQELGSFTVQGMTQIQLVPGYGNPDGMNQIFCRSELIIDNFGTKDVHRSTKVVYDGWYRPGSFVSQDTVCSEASQDFVDQALKEGYRWQGSGVGD